MVSPVFSSEVAAGKKANDSITVYNTELERRGVDTIADLEFYLYIFDSEEWSNNFYSDLIRIETSAAAGYKYRRDDSGDVVYEANGLKIVSKGIEQGTEYDNPGLKLYLENNGSESITVQARDVSVNGYMITPVFSCEIMPGKCAIDGVEFFRSTLEENDIKEIEEMELSFHIFTTEGWNTVDDTEMIRFKN